MYVSIIIFYGKVEKKMKLMICYIYIMLFSFHDNFFTYDINHFHTIILFFMFLYFKYL